MESTNTIDGTVGLTIELELGWAKHDKGELDHLSKRRQEETQTLKHLLALCETLDIPITFNIVGHLLLETCDGVHTDRPGAESWFQLDPGTDIDTDPVFYAPDLVAEIRDSPVAHEICTHTFSHTPCGESTPETVEWELTRAKQAHESVGISWSNVLVPPRHSQPDFNIAEQCGINTLRVPYPKRTFRMSRPERLYHNLFAAHPLEQPKIVSDMCLVYSSPYLSLAAPNLPHGQLDAHPVFRAIPRQIRERWHEQRLQTALKRVAKRERTAHFWSHLWDISNSVQRPLVESFLTTVAERRDNGEIEIVVLGDVRQRMRANQD